MYSRMTLGAVILALYVGSYGSQALGSPGDRHDKDRDSKTWRDHNSGDERERIQSAQLSNWCGSIVRHKAKEQFHTDHLSFSFFPMVTTTYHAFIYRQTVRGSFRVKEGDRKGEKYRYSCRIDGYDSFATISIGSSQELVPIPEELIDVRYKPMPIPIPRDPVPYHPTGFDPIPPV